MMVYLLAGGTALLVSALAVPPTVQVARARNLLDTPDAGRRLHLRAVPRLGGIAVWLGTFIGIGAAAALGLLTAAPREWLGLLAGLALMVAVGFVDDIRGLRAGHKLLAQCLAAGIAVASGFRIETIALTPELTIQLGWLSIPFALFWIVSVTNAFNLIDGLDGLAGGVALVALTAVAVAAVALGHTGMVLPVAIALGGGILGFLRYNASPAHIFLGDVGSLSIGFALAVLTVEGARAPSGDVFMLVPLFALAFPLLDTSIAVLRRWLRGQPLSAADGRHVHHQLVGLGLSHSRAAALISLFAAGVAALGLSISFAPTVLTVALVSLGAVVWVLLVIHGTRWLQYHEFQEAQASFSSGVLRARYVIRDRILARDLEAQIRRAGSLAELELVLDQSCATFGFERVQLVEPYGPGTFARAEPPPPRGRLYRLDCPLGGGLGSERFDFVLRIWWRADTRMPPLYAERVVRMIAPALQDMLATLVPKWEAQLLASGLEAPSPLPLSPTAPVPGTGEIRPRRVVGIASAR